MNPKIILSNKNIEGIEDKEVGKINQDWAIVHK